VKFPLSQRVGLNQIGNRTDVQNIQKLFITATTSNNNEERSQAEKDLNNISSTHVIVGLLVGSMETSLTIQFRLGMVAAVKTYNKKMKQEVGLTAATCTSIINVFFQCMNTFEPKNQLQKNQTDDVKLMDT
jgi:hypothetical protein